MKTPKAFSTRLWVIIAQKTQGVAVFRRTPSRQVQMIKWHLDEDTL